ncbi:MAG: class I SAM-dependent methyltransferase [Anaerolineaceae bacterium]
MADPTNPWISTRTRDGDTYDAVYEQRAAAGEDVHGEANFLVRYPLKSVLDAGCGTGRVTRELAARGLDVAGVDLDPVMLATGMRKAPQLNWLVADLETVDLGRTFDAVLMAGNVMIFLTPGSEGRVLANLASHLNPGGLVVAGFQLRPTGLSLNDYDELAQAAGLQLQERFATWDADPWVAGGSYAVSVHRLAGVPTE